MKSQYKTTIITAKLESWRNYCNATNKSQPWNYIYKAAAGKLKTQTIFTSLKKQDGSYTNSLNETVSVLLDKYVPLDDPRSDNNYNTIIRDKSTLHNISTCNDLPFTHYEVKNVIESFDAHKCPGEDGFNQTIINQIFKKIPFSIVSLYNECFKRGIFPEIWKKSVIVSVIKPGKEKYESAEKYRPISLLSVWGKILEKLLINRIMHFLHKNSLLSEKQFGFTPQKCTLDAIMEVKQYIEDAHRNKEIVLLMSLDVKGAFDAAWWPAILVQLQKFNCPRNLYLLTLDYFRNRKATIKTNLICMERNVTQGCPQGSCCGPGYWILQYDSLLKEKYPLNSLVVAFADDLLVAVKGKTLLEVECLGNSCMRIVERWSLNNKVTFNSSKSNVLIVSRKRNITPVSIFLNNKVLQVVEEMKYLGVVFDSQFSWNNHIRYIADKCFQLVNLLSRSAKVYWGIGSDALRVIYDGALVPLITYALPAWYEGLSKKYNMNKIRRLQRLFLLRVIKGFRTISYEAACVIADVVPIEIKLKEIVKKFRIIKGYDVEQYSNIETPVKPSEWLHPALYPEISILESFQEESFGNGLVIYTDGSKMASNVGSAFVMYSNGIEIAAKKFRLGEHCSNNQAELLAICKALEYLVTYNFSEGALKKVIIRSDSQVSLYRIANYNYHMPLVEEIRSTLNELHQRQFRVHFNKVKAHVGEIGNERADSLAKEAAEDASISSSFMSIPVTCVSFGIEQESLASWEQSWTRSTKGAQTRKFFPTVKHRKKANFPLNFKLTQVLSGHGRCKEYLHRFHIFPDAECKCDSSSCQTWSHILFECPMFDRERSSFSRDIMLHSLEYPPTEQDLLNESDITGIFIKFVNSIDFDKLL